MKQAVIFCLAALFVVATSIELKRTKPLPESLPLVQAYATDKGNVPVKANSGYGFKIQVDVEDNYYDASDSDYGSNTIDMQVALYSSDTIFTYGCNGYSYFSCSSYYMCNSYPSETMTSTTPYFVATGYEVDLPVYVDYNYWYNSDLTATLATSCTGSGPYYYGYNTKGLVGMGTSSSYWGYSTDVFSVYLSSDGTKGNLLFKEDSSYIDYSTTSVTLSATSDWHVTSAVYYVYVGSWSYSVPSGSYANIIFDVNFNAIGLPSTIFSQVNTFLGYYGVKCYSTDKPTCTNSYSYKASNLPSITLSISSTYYGSITIPPQVYIENYDASSTSSFTLNFRSLSTSGSGNNFVTSAYSNYIILGQPFMQYYYTVFNSYFDNTITIYKAKSSVAAWVIVLSVLGGLIFIGMIIACCAYAAKRRNQQFSQPANPTTQPLPSSDTSAVIVSAGAQPVYNPYQPQPQGYAPNPAYYQQYAAPGQPQPTYGAFPNYGANYQVGTTSPTVQN